MGISKIRRNIGFFFSFLIVSILLCTGAKGENPSAMVEEKQEILIQKAIAMDEEIKEKLPASESYGKDPYVQMLDMDWLKIPYSDMYSGYAIEGEELILKLTKESRDSRYKDIRKQARESARKHGASKIRYVGYSLNQLHALYAKASYYALNGNDCGIIMAALDKDSVLIGINENEMNEEKIACAQMLLGNAELLQFAEFSYKDD